MSGNHEEKQSCTFITPKMAGWKHVQFQPILKQSFSVVLFSGSVFPFSLRVISEACCVLAGIKELIATGKESMIPYLD